jgi:hypothetical protein
VPADCGVGPRDQRPPDRRPGELPALLRGGCQLQHRQGLRLGQLSAQRGQRARVELPKCAAQRVDVPLPRPDQALVGTGQDLDRLRQRAVAGNLAMVVPVGADQVGQHLGVAAVGLGPQAPVAPPVAAHHLRVDRIDLVAGGHQRPDQQPAVGLDPDHRLLRLVGMGGHQRVQLPCPGQPVRDPSGGQQAAVLVQQAHVMAAPAPVHPDEQHGILLRSDLLPGAREGPAAP